MGFELDITKLSLSFIFNDHWNFTISNLLTIL